MGQTDRQRHHPLGCRILPEGEARLVDARHRNPFWVVLAAGQQEQRRVEAFALLILGIVYELTVMFLCLTKDVSYDRYCLRERV